LSIASVVFADKIGLSVFGERCVAMCSVVAPAVTSPTRVQAASPTIRISALARRRFSAASVPAFWRMIFSPPAYERAPFSPALASAPDGPPFSPRLSWQGLFWAELFSPARSFWVRLS
jgi:hypothetical protein